MAVMKTLSNLAATLIAALRTRLELAAIEIEEASLRFLSYLLLALAALFCLGLAVIQAVLLIVVICWETNRILALALLTGFFACAGLAIIWGMRRHFQNNPRLFSHSLAELDADAAALRAREPQ